MTANSNQITGIIRAILAAIGGIFVTKGYISGGTLDWVIGGISTLIPTIWTWYDNRPAALAASAQKIDGVNVQVAPSAPEAVKTAVADAKAAGN